MSSGIRRLAARTMRVVLTGAVIVVSVLLARSLVANVYRVPSDSMQPTLKPGARIVVTHLWSELRVGEVVVFHPPRGASTPLCGAPIHLHSACAKAFGKQDSTVTLVKRIVAGPGDTVRFDLGRVIRNGRASDVAPKTSCPKARSGCSIGRTVRVPPGAWYMVGDNRAASNDSRFWGPIPQDWVVGPVEAKIWPPGELAIGE